MCDFEPRLKTGPSKCEEPVYVTYGDRSFCKKHSVSAAAIKARDIEVKAKAAAEVAIAKAEVERVKKEAEEKEKASQEKEAQKAKTKTKAPPKAKKVVEKKEPLPPAPIAKLTIKKNNYGNYVHPAYPVVFKKDPRTKVIYAFGYQSKTGQVKPLREQDIEFCEKIKCKYVAEDKGKKAAKSTPKAKAKKTAPKKSSKKSTKGKKKVVDSDEE